MGKAHMTRRRMLQASGVATATALAGCGGGGGDSDGGGDGDSGGDSEPDVDADTTITVSEGEPHYEPQQTEVAVGDTVAWVAESDQHTVRPDAQPDDAEWNGKTRIFSTGEDYTYTFEVVGDYEYSCFYHSRSGSITVTE